MSSDGGGTQVLLRQLAEGRQEALAELYGLQSQSLLRHALALTQQRNDAEDLVHSVAARHRLAIARMRRTLTGLEGVRS